MSRASGDLMDMLHGLVCKSLVDDLTRAAAATDEEGNPIPINPQLIDKALKMLKDNNITAPASNKPLNDLASKLSELDFDDPAVSLRPN